jgi:hypothetical protein
MSVSSVKTGATGISLLTGNLYSVLNAYESIATVSVGAGGSSSIDFTSIPQTFSHLQIRYITQASNGAYLSVQFNGDTGSTYRWHYVNGDGATASGGDGGADTRIALPRGSASANIFGAGIVDIIEYSNSNKNKTVRGLGGRDTNGAGQLDFNSGVWISTSAITSIKLYHSGVTIPQYSHFALYGMRN